MHEVLFMVIGGGGGGKYEDKTGLEVMKILIFFSLLTTTINLSSVEVQFVYIN